MQSSFFKRPLEFRTTILFKQSFSLFFLVFKKENQIHYTNSKVFQLGGIITYINY